MKACVVVLSRNEELYLDEWISYYITLGFTKIVFVDNNDKDDIAQQNIIRKYNDAILYHDYRGMQMSIDLQKRIYKTMFNKYANEFDWMFFLDVDEFLSLEENLHDFLSKPAFNDASEILFNWQCFDDNDNVFYDSRPVQERFTRQYPLTACYTEGIPEQEIVKCAVNCNAKLVEHNVHTATVLPAITKNALGNSCSNNWRQKPIIHSVAYIKHYATKTIDEFIRRRIIVNKNCRDAPHDKNLLIKRFFNVNKHTDEKDNIVKFIKD